MLILVHEPKWEKVPVNLSYWSILMDVARCERVPSMLRFRNWLVSEQNDIAIITEDLNFS